MLRRPTAARPLGATTLTLTALALGGLTVTGCSGGAGHAPGRSPTPQGSGFAHPHAEPPLPPRGQSAADPATVSVIRAWSTALAGGHVDAAAGYFALPSRLQLVAGGPIAIIRRHQQVVAFNRLLPCGAHLVKARQMGRYVNALFMLANRAGSRCDAPGASARTAFVVRRGLIVEWRRAPSEPGDPGLRAAPATPPRGSPAPSGPVVTSPVV